MRLVSEIKRNNGIAIWRQIADEIRREITAGQFQSDDKMPAENDLAARFGVNRHTVRSAIAALVQEGVLRAEQGRGTFVANAKRLTYRIGKRTRISQALAAQTREMRGLLLSSQQEPASREVSDALNMDLGASVTRLETLHIADEQPVSRATLWIDADRFPNIAAEYEKAGSITTAFIEAGITDYLRKSTVISARHADPDDLRYLKLTPGAIVLTAKAINVDLQSMPIQYSITRFSADRMEFEIENE